MIFSYKIDNENKEMSSNKSKEMSSKNRGGCRQKLRRYFQQRKEKRAEKERLEQERFEKELEAGVLPSCPLMQAFYFEAMIQRAETEEEREALKERFDEMHEKLSGRGLGWITADSPARKGVRMNGIPYYIEFETTQTESDEFETIETE